MESPFDGFFYWPIKQEWQEGHSSQAELFKILSATSNMDSEQETYTDRPISSYIFVLRIFERSS